MKFVCQKGILLLQAKKNMKKSFNVIKNWQKCNQTNAKALFRQYKYFTNLTTTNGGISDVGLKYNGFSTSYGLI